MESMKREIGQHPQKWVSLHDMKITRIIIEKNSVVFFFDEGFDYIKEGVLIHTKKAAVKFDHCNSFDFSCNLVRRRISPKGSLLHGQSLSLEKLNRILLKKRKHVELFLELYDINHVYWRGELLPGPKSGFKRLAPVVTIELVNIPHITYLWD